MFDNFDETDENGNPRFWTGKVDNDELGAWLRLIACGSRMKPKGILQLSGIPLTKEQIKAVIRTDKPYLEKWQEQGAISIKNGIIYIENWKMWQNEQDRKDGYDKQDRLNRPLKSPPKQTQEDVVVVEEQEQEQEQIQKTRTKTLRVPKKSHAPEHSAAISFFCDTYEKNFNLKYPFNAGKDGAIIKDLLRVYGIDRLKSIMSEFLSPSHKPYKDIRTIGMMKTESESLARKTAAPQSDAQKYAPPERKWARGGGYIGD